MVKCFRCGNELPASGKCACGFDVSKSSIQLLSKMQRQHLVEISSIRLASKPKSQSASGATTMGTAGGTSTRRAADGTASIPSRISGSGNRATATPHKSQSPLPSGMSLGELLEAAKDSTEKAGSAKQPASQTVAANSASKKQEGSTQPAVGARTGESRPKADIRYTDGSYYVGDTKDRSPHGFGTMHYVGGNVKSGPWENGTFSNALNTIYNKPLTIDTTFWSAFGLQNLAERRRNSIANALELQLQRRLEAKRGEDGSVSSTDAISVTLTNDIIRDWIAGGGKYLPRREVLQRQMREDGEQPRAQRTSSRTGKRVADSGDTKEAKQSRALLYAVIAGLVLIGTIFIISTHLQKEEPAPIADGEVPAVAANPSENTLVEQIVQNRTATIYLLSDGNVMARTNGDDDYSEVDSWKDVIQIEATSWGKDLLGVTSGGRVLVYGATGEYYDEVRAWEHITRVAMGAAFVAGLREDGTVILAGNNFFKELDTSDWRDIVDIQAGWGHLVGLTASGNVLFEGDSYSESIADPDELAAYVKEYESGNAPSWYPDGRWNNEVIESWDSVVAIRAGMDGNKKEGSSVLGLDANGNVLMGGQPHSLFGYMSQPVLIDKEFSDVTQIEAGECYFAVLKSDGTVDYWSETEDGVEQMDCSAALEWTDIEKIFATDYMMAGRKSDGELLMIGSFVPLE